MVTRALSLAQSLKLLRKIVLWTGGIALRLVAFSPSKPGFESRFFPIFLV